MKTISRVLASLVLVATAGVASAQSAAKDFYVEGGLAPMKISTCCPAIWITMQRYGVRKTARLVPEHNHKRK